MSLTDRDKKIMLVLAPLVLLVGYWFLLLSPQRKEASKASDALTKQEQRRDKAEAKARQLESSKTTFVADYAEMVRLGKAVPTKVDMPSLIVQLQTAARGTGIEFTKIAAGERSQAAAATATAGGSKPADAGGTPAQSAPGKTVETAGNAAAGANKSAAEKDAATDTTTSTATKQGGLSVGGGQSGSSAGAATPGACASGLECVPLDFEFTGRFFDLADFFHRLKRFVRVANDRLEIRGRLMTIDNLKFTSEAETFPALKAEVKTTVYLSPKSEGTTAGASPQGPSSTVPAGSGSDGVAKPSTAATTGVAAP